METTLSQKTISRIRMIQVIMIFLGLGIIAAMGATPVLQTPVAAFKMPAGPITAGQMVQFTDSSSGTPTSWSWTFGDGTTSNIRNPNHLFPTAGKFQVCLKVTNAKGSNSSTQALTVNPRIELPKAAFNYSPSAPTINTVITFKDASGGTPTSWSWNFGDGSTSPDRNPTHTYSKSGSFQVSLKVSNSGGSNSLNKTLAISSAAPPPPPPTGPASSSAPVASGSQYTLSQAMSDKAQLSTIAFSGLAFITGSSGADTFFPPGKVADFFGFQYMRDIDIAGYGHNTTFLTRVAANVLSILNTDQKAKLVALAKIQAPLYVNFAYNRFALMNAFRRCLEGTGPSETTGLSSAAVSAYTGSLYKYDADLSYNRALVVGSIIQSFTDTQKAYLAKMQFNNYATWPAVAEDETFKKTLTGNEYVAVMTYASELFSWYKGSLTADIYFCPERHGTYFGGFFMKDYPAMNNPGYFISTSITGDSGQAFLNILNAEQKVLITGIIDEQRAALAEIAQIRTTVATELRKAMTGGTPQVYALIQRYGILDGQMSALYATRFAAVNKTLTESQRAALIKLRNLTVVPQGAYRFSTPVAMPDIPNTDFLFGVGTMPSNAGQIEAPVSFGK